MTNPHSSDSIRPLLGGILLARFGLNTGFRMIYPFLPTISRGLGISLAAGGTLVTVRAVISFLGLLFGPLSDRYGRQALLLGALLLFVAGSLLCALGPWYGLFLLGFSGMGLAKALFDSTIQAHLGDRLPYRMRGRFMSLTELAWAFSFLGGIPLVGMLIQWGDFRWPFWGLASLGLVSLVAMAYVLRPDHSPPVRLSVLRPYRAVVSNSSARSALAMTGLIVFANENLFIVYGAWLEEVFNLSVSRVGLLTGVLGLADICGELLSSAFVDRLGKRRAVLLGGVPAAVGYLLLPRLRHEMAAVLVGLFLWDLAFEFTICCSFPLVSGLVPTARGTMMSFNVVAMSTARILAPSVGMQLWLWQGLGANGLTSALAMILALVLVARHVREMEV